MTGKKRTSGRRASVLVVALLVTLSLAAIEASGAQALDWQNPARTVLSGTSSESVNGSGSFSISGELLEVPVYVDCSAASTHGSLAAAGTGSSTITGSGCDVVIPTECELRAPLTLEANIDLLEMNGNLYRKFVPATGEEFGTLEFAGPECSLDEAVVGLRGSFAARETSSELLVNRSISLAQTETWPVVELKLGKKPATITGAATEHLSGAQANRPWRGIWQGSNGGWEVDGGETFSSAETVEVSGGPVEFSTVLLGSPISFTCSAPSVYEARLIPGGTEEIKDLSFGDCNEFSPPTCALPGGRLTFEPVTGVLAEIGGDVYEKFTPTFGGTFAAIELVGVECPFTEVLMPISGSFAGLGPEFRWMQGSQPLQFSNAVSAAAESDLKMGQNGVMNMNGAIEQIETGANVGLPWGAF